MAAFHLAGHLRELPADHRVVHELLPEGLPLVRELEALLEADPREAVGHPASGAPAVQYVNHMIMS